MDTAHKLMNEFYDLSDDVLEAIAARFETILPTLPTGESHEGMGFCYDGFRARRTATIVFRFGRNLKGDLSFHRVDGITAERVTKGDFDNIIVDSFKDCAQTDYWYKYHKDYGSFD